MNIEKLKELPKREKYRDYGYWYRRRTNYHKIGDYFPYKVIERICSKFLGKSFDEAFSYFCTLVPQYQQHLFIEEFNTPRYRYGDYYYLEDNIIKQFKYKRDKQVVLTSHDYKIEYRHKLTKELKESRYWWWKEKEDDFVAVIVSGWKKTFSSAKDPKYKRLRAEEDQKQKKQWKETLKQREEKAYDFLTESEKLRKVNHEINNNKILSHGFDLKTSFRNEKESNKT